MTLHAGSPNRAGAITFSSPVPRAILASQLADDVEGCVRGWLHGAEMREDIYYFSIHLNDTVVDQVFLHDIDETATEALVEYHLFDPGRREQGVGTTALRLLQRFVAAETSLKRLIPFHSGLRAQT